MPRPKDPTAAIRKRAASLPGAGEGVSCNQSAFKVGKAAFLYLGPGAKGVGFKAMFKLDGSLAQAAKLAKQEPDRYGVGSTSWVTARFTAEDPLAKTIWEAWLKESYALATGGGPAKPARKKVAQKKTASKATSKKAPRKEATKKKTAKKAGSRKKASRKKGSRAR